MAHYLVPVSESFEKHASAIVAVERDGAVLYKLPRSTSPYTFKVVGRVLESAITTNGTRSFTIEEAHTENPDLPFMMQRYREACSRIMRVLGVKAKCVDPYHECVFLSGPDPTRYTVQHKFESGVEVDAFGVPTGGAIVTDALGNAIDPDCVERGDPVEITMVVSSCSTRFGDHIIHNQRLKDCNVFQLVMRCQSLRSLAPTTSEPPAKKPCRLSSSSESH